MAAAVAMSLGLPAVAQAALLPPFPPNPGCPIGGDKLPICDKEVGVVYGKAKGVYDPVAHRVPEPPNAVRCVVSDPLHVRC